VSNKLRTTMGASRRRSGDPFRIASPLLEKERGRFGKRPLISVGGSVK